MDVDYNLEYKKKKINGNIIGQQGLQEKYDFRTTSLVVYIKKKILRLQMLKWMANEDLDTPKEHELVNKQEIFGENAIT